MKLNITRCALFLGICLSATLTLPAQNISPQYNPLITADYSYTTLLSLKNDLYGGTEGRAAENDCSNTPGTFNGNNVIYVSPQGNDYLNGYLNTTASLQVPLLSGTAANNLVASLQSKNPNGTAGQLVCFVTGTYQPFTITQSGKSYTDLVRFEVVPGNIATIDLTCGGVVAGCEETNQYYAAGIDMYPPGRYDSTKANFLRYVLVTGFFVHGPDGALSQISGSGAASSASPYPYYHSSCIAVEGNQGGSKFVFGAEADHIYIVANTLEGCTGGGVGVGYSDYVTIDGNIIYNTDWYTIYAQSAISVLSSVDTNPNDSLYKTDKSFTYKNYIVNNTIFNNFQYVANGGNAGAGTPGTFSDGEGIIIDTNLNSAAGSAFQGPATCPNPQTAQYCIAPYSSYTLVSNNQIWGNGSSAIESTLSRNVDITFNTTFNNDLNPPESNRAEISVYDSLNIRVYSNLLYASGFDTTFQQIYDGFGQEQPYISGNYPSLGTVTYDDNTGFDSLNLDMSYPTSPVAYPPNQAGNNGDNHILFANGANAYAGAPAGSPYYGEYATSFDTVYNTGGLALAPTDDPSIQNSTRFLSLPYDILGNPRPSTSQTVAVGAFNVPY